MSNLNPLYESKAFPNSIDDINDYKSYKSKGIDKWENPAIFRNLNKKRGSMADTWMNSRDKLERLKKNRNRVSKLNYESDPFIPDIFAKRVRRRLDDIDSSIKKQDAIKNHLFNGAERYRKILLRMDPK